MVIFKKIIHPSIYLSFTGLQGTVLYIIYILPHILMLQLHFATMTIVSCLM